MFLFVFNIFQSGANLNYPGNTVIIGHNYRNGLFFGDNDKLDINDSVFITDVKTGSKVEYKIYKKFITAEEDTSFYNRNTDGNKEITLVTCKKNDNSYRLVLLAREI